MIYKTRFLGGKLTLDSVPHHQADVTAVIAQKPQNGEEDRTEHGHFAMPAVYVRIIRLPSIYDLAANYILLHRLRQAHQEDGCK